MKFQILFITLIIVLNFSILAEETKRMDRRRPELDQQVEEIMRTREEMFRSLLNDDSFEMMEKRMLEMMKRFDHSSFEIDEQNFFNGPVVGEYDWIENDQFKILKIKVVQIKDKPLDIKIEKGLIKIKGDVEEVNKQDSKNGNKRQISKVHFERSFSLPIDVDQNNPEFENKDGEMWIKFKKKKPTKLNNKSDNKSEKRQEKVGPSDQDEFERRPIEIKKEEISI